MKVLFAGPTLHGLDLALDGLTLRPPARQGDVLRAVLDGATAIGLIDGVYEAIPAVWHKEILHALSLGVTVLGGASMGALRAAECAAFGMVPVGVIAHAYLDGTVDDDAAVALLHGPAEWDYVPFTEALVDAEATIERLAAAGILREAERVAMLDRARGLFFKDRTVEAMCAGSASPEALSAAYGELRVGLKQRDAAELIDALRLLPDTRSTDKRPWTLAQPAFWRSAMRTISDEHAPIDVRLTPSGVTSR